MGSGTPVDTAVKVAEYPAARNPYPQHQGTKRMPQLMIDTAAESAESLRLLAVLLTSYAGIKDAEGSLDRSAGLGIGQTAQAALAARAHTVTTDTLRAEGFVAAADRIEYPEPVPQGTNVIPFPAGLPSLPALPSVVTAVEKPADSTAQSAAGANTVASAGQSAQGATLPNVPGATVELDAAGIPWDERIHQSNRNKKADNTWMLKRGLDKTLAATVLAELAAAKLANFIPPVSTATGPIPGTGSPAAPVTLPPVGLPLPPPPVGLATGQVVLATLPPPPNSAALPALPNGVPAQLPAAALTPVQRFSAMMVKINAAKAVGVIDQSMIDEAHRALDLPQLQLAITQPDKIPMIEAALGL